MIHVLYHANCYDGFGAAWAAWRKLGDEGVAYRPVNYGDQLPEVVDGDQIFVLDFSWPRQVLLDDWGRREIGLIVLDHHKTAQAELAGLSFATFDLDKSGSVLAWEHFHPGVHVPTMLQYVQDRDLWHFKLPGSREVASWMRSWPFDFARWSVLAAAMDQPDLLKDVWGEGEAILRFQSRQVEIMADNAVMLTLGGHKVHAANATCFFSEVGEELCRRYSDELFAAYWLDRNDGKRQWGLRSRGGFDCTTVAKQYGGGGHPGAAGFTTDSKWCGGW